MVKVIKNIYILLLEVQYKKACSTYKSECSGNCILLLHWEQFWALI